MIQTTKLSLFIVALFLISCSPKTDELVKGSWTFEKLEIVNYDELIEKQIEVSKLQIEKDIESIQLQISESEDETTKEVLEASLTQYLEAKENLPARAKEAKEQTMKRFDEIVGKATMDFNENNSFERKFDASDITTGTWKLTEDMKSILVTEKVNEQEKVDEYIIEEISSTKLVLMIIESEGDMVMKMKMKLKK